VTPQSLFFSFFRKFSSSVLFLWLQFFCSFTLLDRASLSVTALLFFSKILPLDSFISFSKKSSPLSLRLSSSIYKQEKKEPPLLCPIVVQGGKRDALPVQGKVAGCLHGMVSLSFIYHVGRVCGSKGCCQFYASGREIN